MLQDLVKLELETIIGVMATIIGAFGGFPQPPQAFLNLTKHEPIQWFLVFVLAYQGGHDPVLAVIATVVTFVIYKVMHPMEGQKEPELLV